jgi:hypothetical protein
MGACLKYLDGALPAAHKVMAPPVVEHLLLLIVMKKYGLYSHLCSHASSQDFQIYHYCALRRREPLLQPLRPTFAHHESTVRYSTAQHNSHLLPRKDAGRWGGIGRPIRLSLLAAWRADYFN